MRRVVVALLSLVVGMVSAFVAAGPAAAADCPKLYVIAVPGTWSQNGPGLLGPVTSGLGPETQVAVVRYDATAFPWEAAVYGKSKAQAVSYVKGLAIKKLRACPQTKIALTGYSQGADAAGDVANEIGSGREAIRPNQIAGVVLLADPRRSAKDTLIGPELSGQGSGGPRLNGMGWLSAKTRTICIPTDLYCNTPRDYYITRIIGYLAETSNPTPSQIGVYQAEASAIFVEMLTRGGPGRVVAEVSNTRARQQIIAFNRFIQSRSHGDYGSFEVKPGVTATEWARNYLADLA